MQGAKQKVKDMASAAKQHAQIYEAKVEEQAEKAGARTEEERQLATERRKIKEAEAKAELHASKAHHVAEKLDAKQRPLHIPGVGPTTGHQPHYTPGGVQPAPGAQYGYPETGHVASTDPLYPAGTHHVPGAGTHHIPGLTGTTRHVPGAAPYTTDDPAVHHHVTGRRLL